MDRPDLDVPFRTTLDPSSSLNGLYDPSLVELALVSVSLRRDRKSGPRSDNNKHPTPMAEFVDRYNSELAVLTDFIRTSYSIRRISQMTAVETSNVLYIFRDLYSKGKVLAVNPNNMASFDDMVASFWSLLEHSQERASVPRIVDSLLDSSKLAYVDLYSLGIGNFLSELRVLATEFDFNSLPSLDPVVAKISALVSEFSKFLQEHDDSHHYDLEFFRVVIYVLRYKKLQDILVAVGQKNISPRDLLVLTTDPDAESIQKVLGDKCGEPLKLENLFFVQHRNFFNVIYTAVGFALFDTIFAALYLEAQKPVYSDEEKAQFDSFFETFLPLVCGGLVPIDSLQNAKYSCLSVRYDGRVLAPFKVSDNICENYSFSLAMLFDLPSRYYLIAAASPYLKKPFEGSSIEEITKAISSATKKSSLLQEEGEKLVAALKEMLPYSIDSFRILDRLLIQPNLLHAANKNDTHLAYVTKVAPEVVDLTSTVTAETEEPELSLSSIRINNLELTDFKKELADFKSKDLSNIPYVSIGDKNIIKLLTARISDVLSRNSSSTDSAVNPDNVASYATVLELLGATFDINGGETVMLDNISKDVAAVSRHIASEPSKEYAQIPEYLGIHDFWAELEILKTDELKRSFKEVAPERILSLMNERLIELNNGLSNSNPTSRMDRSNLARFMKLEGRLSQLFKVNNGNTEVLDAVLKSQSEIQKLDEKLEVQRRQREAKKAESGAQGLYAPGPYLQIPDKMQLHEFVKELEIFRHDDLRSSFKNFSAERILGLMQKRIKEIYSDLPCTNQALRMSKDNLVAFIRLHAKLEKLLAWNGGNTEILDTLIHSQSVFNHFEEQLAKKKQNNETSETPATHEASETTAYRQMMDDMRFEEFAEELIALKQKLGKNFKSTSTDEVLSALQELTEAEGNADIKLIYGKLARNLLVLFKHNNNETFVLDNVLLNVEAFKTFEKSLADASAAENKFDMSEFLDNDKVSTPIDYHSEDYVLSLLNANNTPANLDLDTEATIKEALSSALSKAENKLLEEDPEEYAAINNLTAQKIRESYAQTKKADEGAVRKIDKESLEKFLKSTKDESDRLAKLKRREKQAYEWSSCMANHQRSLETGNYFNSLLSRGKSKDFPMFPISENKEYMVLTTTGQTFVSKENPLGSDHVPEDILAILDRFDEVELEKFSKNVKKLQRKHWKLIGGGGNDRMLVLSRTTVSRKKRFLSRIKTMLASTGFVFFTFIALNIWLDDEHPDRVSRQHSASQGGGDQTVETAVPDKPASVKPAPVVVVEREPGAETSPLSRPSNKSLWQRLMWKD